MKASNVTIASLHFDCSSYCKTNAELKTFCSALALAQKWRVRQLHLLDMGGEGWEALSKVAERGQVEILWVDEFGLRSAKKQHICALWKATADSGYWINGRSVIKKRKGDAGLQRLLALGGHNTVEWEWKKCLIL